VEWRKHPETKRLIEFLQTSKSGLLELAVVQNSNNAEATTINKTLAKAKAVGEILEYVTNNE
jgi:hypothetical protein